MVTGSVEAFLPQPSLIVGLRLGGKKAAVFGSGASATSRAMFALDAGADVVMYAHSTPSSISKWVENGRLTLVPQTKYASSDMSAFSIAFVADAPPADQQMFAYDAQAAGVPVNVAGNATLSDFVLMPTYRGSSSLQIAVTTNGVAPRVASRLLEEIVGKLPSDLETQLTDVARLSAVALGASRERDEALAKLEGESTGILSSLEDTSSVATATQTPELPLSSSESEAEESAPASVFGLSELRDGPAQHQLDADVQVASSYVAHALSDLCFVYSAPEQELGEAALIWSRRAEKNAYGGWASALRMETRAGAGHALWGALSSGSRVTAIASAASLPFMLPVLSELVARRQPIVVHAAAQSLDHFASAQTDFSDALVALQSQAAFLVSSSAQEAHDIALIAHAVSQAASVPVVHLTNGAHSASEAMTVRMASHAHLVAYVGAVSAAARKLDYSLADTVQLAFSQFKSSFGRTYYSFEYCGSPVAETVFVSLGEVAARVQALLPRLLSEADFGMLSVRILRPWSLSEFTSRLPSTTKRLVVLNALGDCDGSPDALFTDVSLSALLGRSALPIGVQSRNVYGTDQRAFDDAIREELGLQMLPAEILVSANDLEQQQQQQQQQQQHGGAPLLLAAPLASVSSVHDVAQRLAFPEAFAAQLSARPGEKTFDVKVTSLYRMTPETYDRNIFHIEFDTRGTDLAYEIGDALGVYGHNDPSQVSDFCKLLGLDGSRLITAVKDEQCQTRSIQSWLTHALDLFGRPSKRFYAALADFAADEKEAEKLRWLTTAEGSAEFKERVADTTTYADLLLEFASARPSFLHLVDLVAPIKPRHYSIASSAKMHPGSVHLCVVSVEWRTSKGELRAGQCTRFLSSLSIGDRVVVSVKPSVMKLPPIDSQPVIMAGLGTGMAPFRAFIEERAVLKMQGAKVGPMTLYFGSRHRAMEYLYGEELEAYHADGLLTNLRLAFSRDQKEKVYIQHRMRDDSELLASQMLGQDGCFYLCGPTWPASDVKDAMVGAFTAIGGVKPSDANKVIETLKESERYILEVY